MAHPTYPVVFFDERSGLYKCEMRDKKTGKVWGHGYGERRQDAIANARYVQPSDGQIKRAINWVTRHPFIGGAAAGAMVAYYHAKRSRTDVRLGDMMASSVVFGAAAWIIVKIAKFFSARRVVYEAE